MGHTSQARPIILTSTKTEACPNITHITENVELSLFYCILLAFYLNSNKKKKHNLPADQSIEVNQRLVLWVKSSAEYILKYFSYFFEKKQDLTFFIKCQDFFFNFQENRI